MLTCKKYSHKKITYFLKVNQTNLNSFERSSSDNECRNSLSHHYRRHIAFLKGVFSFYFDCVTFKIRMRYQNMSAVQNVSLERKGVKSVFVQRNSFEMLCLTIAIYSNYFGPLHL